MTLSIRQKPLATDLFGGEDNEYHSSAVVSAINFARAYGFSQILATQENKTPNQEHVTSGIVKLVDDGIARAKTEIDLLSVTPDEFEITVRKATGWQAVIELRSKSAVAK